MSIQMNKLLTPLKSSFNYIFYVVYLSCVPFQLHFFGTKQYQYNCCTLMSILLSYKPEPCILNSCN